MKRTPNRDGRLLDALAQLKQSTPPRRDRWPEISRKLTSTAQPRPATPRWPLALAAALVPAVLVGGLWWAQHDALVPAAAPAQIVEKTPTAPAVRRAAIDPRLLAADIELSAAEMQLELALQRAPNAQFLKDLLTATAQRHDRLVQTHRPAG